MLSNVLSGDKVSVLVNNGWEPDREDKFTRVLLLDRGTVPFSQVMSMVVTETEVSVKELREMEQVKVRGAVLPAKSGPGGTETLMFGVETGKMLSMSY